MSAFWPSVCDEFETIDAVISGKSLARFGDGEYNIMLGGNCVSQKYDPKLEKELRAVMWGPHKNCIVGTVRKMPESPKNWFWDNITSRKKTDDLHNPAIKYYSAFVTRPDSAPWIITQEYWQKVTSLWRDKDVSLVAGSGRSLTPEKLKLAKSVQLIEATYRDSYAIVSDLEKRCLDSKNHVILLCCGATATVLANRLSPHKHAIDLGHIGMFEKHYAGFNI
jgi:hypothetical protein